MTDQIKYLQFDNTYFEQLLEMSQKLWKKIDRLKLENLLKQSTQLGKYNIFMARDSVGRYVGFSIFSLRTDYVEGVEKSPTGYLEGIFVETEYRKRGIAKEFIRMGELWCKNKGCSQMGSDTWLTATESREFHKRVGFSEEDEIVHFLKKII